MLARDDGTSVYLARDIAYHLKKVRLGDSLINVLGEDHKFEFQELKTILTNIYKLKTPLDVLHYSFVSFEGFLNAKLLVEVLREMGDNPTREGIQEAMEGIEDLDLGIDALVSFGPGKHQGLDVVYYTRVKGDRFVPLEDWKEWAK